MKLIKIETSLEVNETVSQNYSASCPSVIRTLPVPQERESSRDDVINNVQDSPKDEDEEYPTTTEAHLLRLARTEGCVIDPEVTPGKYLSNLPEDREHVATESRKAPSEKRTEETLKNEVKSSHVFSNVANQPRLQITIVTVESSATVHGLHVNLQSSLANESFLTVVTIIFQGSVASSRLDIVIRGPLGTTTTTFTSKSLLWITPPRRLQWQIA